MFQPRTLAPLFWMTAVMHGAALLTRFDAIGDRLPDFVPPAILWLQIPMILVASFFESQIDYGEQLESLPLWMRIKSVPVKISFTLAFTYLAVVALQTIDLEIGPIDPTPPMEWSVGTRARYFLIMSVGMFFPNYLAATSLLVPPLRRVTGFFHSRLPLVSGLAVTAALGVALGTMLVYLVFNLGSQVEGVVAVAQNPFGDGFAATLGMTLGGIFVPMALGWVLEKAKARRQAGEGAGAG